MGIANCPATCGECQACADSTTWTDDWGGDCASHSGNNCNDFTNCCGWSQSQQDDLIANCPATCGECQVPTPAPTPVPTPMPAQACADSTTWTDDWGGDCASHS